MSVACSLIGGLICGAIALAAGSARAESDQDVIARELTAQAHRAYASGDYVTAQRLFHRAGEIAFSSATAIFEARSLARLGRQPEADALYRRIFSLPMQGDARSEATKSRVEATSSGRATAPAVVSTYHPVLPSLIPETDRGFLSAHDAGGSSWMRTTGLVSLGVGAAGIGTGVVAVLLASTKRSDAACPGGRCVSTPDPRDSDPFKGYHAVSTAGFTMGLIGAAGGITLLALAPSHREAAPQSVALKVFCSPARAGVKGTF